MANYTLSVTSKDKFRNDFESSRFVRILDNIGLKKLYRDAVAKDLRDDPYVFMDDNYIATLEKHTSLLDGLKHTAKDAYGCVSDSIHYTLDNPRDVARIPYDVLKAVITSPKALGIGILGLAVGGSGCTDKILGDDTNKSISDYLGDIVVDEENNITLNDSVGVAKDVVSTMSGGVDDVSNPNSDNILKSNKPVGIEGYGVEYKQFKTPDGMMHFAHPDHDGGYLGGYDIDGDHGVDVIDDVLSKSAYTEIGVDFKRQLKGLGVPYDHIIYELYPDFDELRFRFFDLNKDANYMGAGDQLQLIIDGELILTLTEDLNGNSRLDIEDVFIKFSNDFSDS